MTNDAEAKRRTVEAAFGSAAPVYHKSPYFAEPGRRLVELAELKAEDKVLDIATGRGAVLFPAAVRVSPNGFVHGIDLAEPMVSATSAEIASRGFANADVQKMDAEHLYFADACFDVALCGFALWFIPDLVRALAEVRRVLKAGGKFAASTWAAPNELDRRYNELLRSYGVRPESLSSHSLRTPESLRAAFLAAGFLAASASYEGLTVVFHDEEDWWENAGSAPQRMQNLSSESREGVKQGALALARNYRTTDGITITRQYVLATATSPG